MPLDLDRMAALVQGEAAAPSGQLPSNEYVCKITGIENNELKKYIKIEFDIHEGEYESYFEKLHVSTGEYYKGFVYQSYTDNAQRYFQAFLQAVTDSNPGFALTGKTETSLVGQLVGMHLKPETYRANNGDMRTRYKMVYATSIDRIRAKNPQ